MYENRALDRFTSPDSSGDCSAISFFDCFYRVRIISTKIPSYVEKSGDHPVIISQNAFSCPYQNLNIIARVEHRDDRECGKDS